MSLNNYENELSNEHNDNIYDPNTTSSSNSTPSSDIDDDIQDDLLDNSITIKTKTSNMYQENSLAAAQMLQLMSSTGGNAQQSHDSSNGGGGGVVVVDHEKENIPICKYCNKVFANFSNLNHHISAIHLNQSKWICSQCSKVCSSKSNLKVHLRVHLRVKPYHCRWCSYSCMHHSSIRDHLAKVHPEKTHTPLQPGYVFNSQAVPEPDVFNSKGFNASNYVNETKMKRTNDKMQSERTPKKSRLNDQVIKQQQQQLQQQQPATLTHLQSSHYPTLNISPTSTNNGQSMSNIYNAYTMARMLPFMYPMHLQYAAAAAAANQQQQQQQQQQFGLYNTVNQFQQHQQRLYSTTNISTNSFEDQTTSSYSSNSHSSRSSSLSPSDKTTNEIVNLMSKQIKQIATSIDDRLISSSVENIKQESIETQTVSVEINTDTDDNKSSIIIPTMASSPKQHNTTLTVDQILSNKSNKSTQTDNSCLKCPYCSGKAF